jgi:hypothetical protein
VLAAANEVIGGRHDVLVAIIAAVGTGMPALAYTIWRGRKLGPKEEDNLVARVAQEAAAAASTMLTAAREERQDMRAKIEEQRRYIAKLERSRKASG